MSDLHELRDLAGDVRDRVITPSYDEVSRRVRARRLRGAVGTVAAAAVVMGALAVWQSVATTTGPPRPQPADTQGPMPPTDESQWRAVVDGPDAHPFETEGTDDGSIAVVWRALEPGAPTFALVIRDAAGTLHGMRLDEPVSLTPVPGGWVGVSAARGYFIDSDGRWTDLGEPAPSRSPRAGDVVVHGQYSSWLYSSADQGWTAMPEWEGGPTDAYVTPEGDLVTCQQDGRGEIFVSPTGKMIRGLPGETCVLAGRGDDAAVVALGDDPDGGIPMTGLAIMTGLTPGHSPTWRFPRTPDLLDGVTSVVVTTGGRTVITDNGTGDWFLIGADGQLLPTDRQVGEAFVAGDRLYVTTYGLMNGPIYYSEDDGHTWHETVLPGNED